MLHLMDRAGKGIGSMVGVRSHGGLGRRACNAMIEKQRESPYQECDSGERLFPFAFAQALSNFIRALFFECIQTFY